MVLLTHSFGYDLTKDADVRVRERWAPSDQPSDQLQYRLAAESAKNSNVANDGDSLWFPSNSGGGTADGLTLDKERGKGKQEQEKWISLLQKNFELLRNKQRQRTLEKTLTEVHTKRTVVDKRSFQHPNLM